MSDPLRIAVSGLTAAANSVAASARNIANAVTPGYQPVESFNEPQQTGDTPTGVRAGIRNSGTPGVSIDKEVVDLHTATAAYEANAAVIKAADKLQDELLKALDTRA